jgi:hypothetical protein
LLKTMTDKGGPVISDVLRKSAAIIFTLAIGLTFVGGAALQTDQAPADNPADNPAATNAASANAASLPSAPPTPAPSGPTYYVSASGNDANAGSLSAPWRTIQKAANTLVAGRR